MTRSKAKLYMYMGFKIQNAQRTKHMLWGEVSVAPSSNDFVPNSHHPELEARGQVEFLCPFQKVDILQIFRYLKS